MASIQERLTALGFALTGTGGNCDAYIRSHGDIEEMITVDGEAIAPTSEQDRVTLSTSDGEANPTWDDDAERVPLWALLEALEGCDCYALAGLRWANRHAADAHDATCKRWKG